MYFDQLVNFFFDDNAAYLEHEKLLKYVNPDCVFRSRADEKKSFVLLTDRIFQKVNAK